MIRAAAAIVSRLFPFGGFSLPTAMYVEATNRCILRCAGCPTANGASRKKGDMSLFVFKKIMDDIGSALRTMDFGYSGEPLLNDRLSEMVRLASEKGIHTTLDTNGMLLEEKAEALVSSGLGFIRIGLDGPDQASLERFRRRADFAKIVAGIKRLCGSRRGRGRRPHVQIQVILMRHNEGRVAEIVDLAKACGVDSVLTKSFSAGLDMWASSGRKAELAREFLPSAAPSRYGASGSGSPPGPGSGNGCSFAGTMTVLWNGDVSLCCMDFRASHVIGNVLDGNVGAIWRRRANRDLRRSMSRRGLDICNRCHFRNDDRKEVFRGADAR